jgi:hypothetical protein
VVAEKLWLEFFSDPSQWWDHSIEKVKWKWFLLQFSCWWYWNSVYCWFGFHDILVSAQICEKVFVDLGFLWPIGKFKVSW